VWRDFRDVAVPALLALGSVVWLVVVPLMFLGGAMTAYGPGLAAGDERDLQLGDLARRGHPARGRGRFGDHASPGLDLVLRELPRGGRRRGGPVGPDTLGSAPAADALRRAERRRQ
jgi:hypothetical protein